MTSFPSGLLTGLIAGAAATALAFVALRPRPEPPAPPRPAAAASPDPVAPLKEENLRLTKRIEELERTKPVPPPARKEEASAAKPTIDELKAGFGSLVEKGLGAFRDPKFGDAVKAVKEAGKPAVEFLMNALRTGATATERFLAAALLEGAGDATAIPALADAMKDKDDLVRRMASHALAVIGTADAEAPLKAASTGDADWGVRVNSAYGLAKLGNDEGLRILREAYESSATPTEYRLGILGGLADVAAPSTAPLFRRILGDTKDLSYRLIAIAALEKMKDAQAIPVLQQIVDGSEGEMVKQAAAKAIDAIRK